MEPTSDCQVTLGAGSLAMLGKEKWRHGKILIRIWDGTYLRLPGDAGYGHTGYYWEGEDGCLTRF